MLIQHPSIPLKDDANLNKPRKSLKTPVIKSFIDQVLYNNPKRLQTSHKRDFEQPQKQPQEENEQQVIRSVNQNVSCEDQKAVVRAIARYLTSLVDYSTTGLKDFEGQQVPSISLHEYVDRLIRYVDAWAGEKPSPVSTGVSCALMGVEYMDRINVPVSEKSVHRLYLCSVLVAVKFTEDFVISNRFWAKVGGIDLEEMNKLELGFCSLIDWKLGITSKEFESQQVRFANIKV